MTLKLADGMSAENWEGAHPALEQLLALARSSGRSYTYAAGWRSEARKAELYSWGRTVKNPDMARTGELGPNGLGVLATNVRPGDESAHDRRADGLFYGVDLWGDNAALASEAKAAGIAVEWGGEVVTLADGRKDPNHFQVIGWRGVPRGSNTRLTKAGMAVGVGLALGLLALVVIVNT